MMAKSATTPAPTASGTAPVQASARAGSSSGVVGAAVYAASGLSLAAALIHLWVAPNHFNEWWAHAAFFLFVALAQGLFAVLLIRWPGRTLSLAGIFGNLALVLLYIVSRTAGIPLGPHAGRVEEASVLGMAATAAEVSIAVLLLALLDGRTRSFAINALFVAGAAVWALRLAGVLS